MIRIDAKILWEATRSRSGNWIATCGALGLAMESGTLDELEVNINQSIQLLLATLADDGELEIFLENHGWRMEGRRDNDALFDVPIELFVRSGRDSSRTLLQ